MLDRDQLYCIKVYQADPLKLEGDNGFFAAMQDFKNKCLAAGITQVDVLMDELRDKEGRKVGTPLAIIVFPVSEQPKILFEPWEPKFKESLQTFESYVVKVAPDLSLPGKP